MGIPRVPRLASALFLLAACVVVAGCDYPRDPEETLERVEGGTMKVGVAENPPWVVLDEGKEPQGVEPTLLREFAEELDAEIEWVEGSEAELVAAMRGFQIDVIAAGLDRGSPWKKEVALTRPYVDTEVEFAVPPGEDLPDDLDEEKIFVEDGSEAAALLQQEESDAIPVYYESLEEVDGPALLHTYEIEAIGYERTDRIQRDHEHCMAVAMGENAFMVELEDFLLDKDTGPIEDLVNAEARKQVLK